MQYFDAVDSWRRIFDVNNTTSPASHLTLGKLSFDPMQVWLAKRNRFYLLFKIAGHNVSYERLSEVLTNVIPNSGTLLFSPLNLHEYVLPRILLKPSSMIMTNDFGKNSAAAGFIFIRFIYLIRT